MGKISRRSFAIGAGVAAGSVLLGVTEANSAVSTYRVGGVSVRKYTPVTPNGRPAIIMVHGGAHAGWAWNRYATYFSSLGWECHVLDWYNHGQSDILSLTSFIRRSILNVTLEIQMVMGVLRGVGRPYIYMGHSMGGLASLHSAAFLDPEALVLIAPVVPAQVGAEAIQIAVDLSTLFPVPPFPVAKAMFFSTMTDAEAMPYYLQLQPESSRAVWEATRWTASVNLDGVTVPTMTVAAGADVLTPPAAIRTLADLLDCRHVDWPGIGHSDVLLKSSGWLPVAQDIENWLRHL